MRHMMIGFCGYARSGKDYCANTLASYLAKHPDIHVERYAMASPIKRVCNDMFGWDERHADGPLKELNDPFWGFSPRYAYQTFGTEWARNMLGDDIWCKFAKRRYEAAVHHADIHCKAVVFIIGDVRFQNEVDMIHASGGKLISVTNAMTEPQLITKWFGLSKQLVSPNGVRQHVSESFVGSLREQADFHVRNEYQLGPDAQMKTDYDLHCADIMIQRELFQ